MNSEQEYGKQYLKILVAVENQINKLNLNKSNTLNNYFSKWDYIIILVVVVSTSLLYFDYYLFYKFPEFSVFLNIEVILTFFFEENKRVADICVAKHKTTTPCTKY